MTAKGFALRFALGLLFATATGQERNDAALIKQGELDINPLAPIGLAFESYAWFESAAWAPVTIDGHRYVDFTGVIPHDQAMRDFRERNRYKLRLGLKTMQLAPYYRLPEPERRKKLRFVVRFIIHDDDSFAVHAGWLGVQTADEAWTSRRLENKALLEMIRGLYANRDPYAILIEGLPYR